MEECKGKNIGLIGKQRGSEMGHDFKVNWKAVSKTVKESKVS